MIKVTLHGGPLDDYIVEWEKASEMVFTVVTERLYTHPLFGWAAYELADSGEIATFVREGIFNYPVL